jgi:hypothetical protein
VTKARWISLLSIAALCVAVVALLLGGSAARADSWAMPEVAVTPSANGEFRFTVTPADIGSQLAYFRDEVAAENSGQPVERPAPLGLLEQRDAKGKWTPVWAGPLMNPVAPVSVLVADDGRHVVTFDNWHSVGHGEHVIVIYGPEGALVRSLSLTDLVLQDYIEALPRSVSSLDWRRDARFAADGTSVVISVVVPHDRGLGEKAETVPFTIALADGAVTMPPPAQWEAALAAAATVRAARAEADARWLAKLKTPLIPPEGCAERDWHEYLRAAPGRLSSEAPSETYPTIVLLPRDHPRYRESLKRLRDSVGGRPGFPINAAFASPCDPDGLVAAFAKAVKKVKPGSVPDRVTFYIAAPAPQFAAIASLVSPTGAKTVWIDTAVPIPQRPDRIPGTPEYEAAMQAERDSLDAELGPD